MKQSALFLTHLLFAYTSINSASALMLGDKAPNCSLTPFYGQAPNINIEHYRNKVMYVDFWASWCIPCVKSFPFMNKLNTELEEKGLQIIGINLDEAREDADQFITKFSASFSLATDLNQQCAKDFGVKAMPSSYIIDRKGIVRHIHIGFRPGETEELRNVIEQVLAERPIHMD